MHTETTTNAEINLKNDTDGNARGMLSHTSPSGEDKDDLRPVPRGPGVMQQQAEPRQVER